MNILETNHRRREVEQLLLQGRRAWEIAAELNLSASTVKLDVCRIRQQWARDALRPPAELIAEALARLRGIEGRLWVEWDRSRESSEKTSRVRKATPTGEHVQVSTGEEKQLGDVRYLALIVQCVDRRTRLLGLSGDQLHRAPSLEESPELQALIDSLPNEQHEQINAAGALIEGLLAKLNGERGT